MQNKPVVKIKMLVPWLRILVGLLIVLQLIDPNKAWMILLTGFGGLWLLMYIWNRGLAGGLRLEREQLYGWLQVGDWLEESFRLTNHSSFPAAWVSIEDESNLPGYTVSMGTGIDASSQRRWKKRTPCQRRGIYQLGPLSVKTGDIFGLYSVEIRYPDTKTFPVSPPVISLPFSIQVISGRRVDENKFSRLLTEKSIDSIYAREYEPGDSYAKIHWMITARKDTPHVRVFENVHASNAWWILLDLDRRVQSGEGDRATDEHAIILAASLADLGLRKGKSVGMIASGSETSIHLARYGFIQRSNIMRTLARIDRGEMDLKALIELSQGYLPRNSNVVIITASERIDWIESTLKFRGKQVNPTILLVGSGQPENTNKLRAAAQVLARQQINHHLLHPKLFDTPEARPGKYGEIRWKVTPHGRAIMIRSEKRGGT